jgi:hypothetical protein
VDAAQHSKISLAGPERMTELIFGNKSQFSIPPGYARASMSFISPADAIDILSVHAAYTWVDTIIGNMIIGVALMPIRRVRAVS